MTELKIGQKINVEIQHLTEDGKGVGFGPDEEVIIIDGVSDEDETVRVEIYRVFEETAIGKKIRDLSKGTQSDKQKDENPYPLDNDDEFEETEDEQFYKNTEG